MPRTTVWPLILGCASGVSPLQADHVAISSLASRRRIGLTLASAPVQLVQNPPMIINLKQISENSTCAATVAGLLLIPALLFWPAHRITSIPINSRLGPEGEISQSVLRPKSTTWLQQKLFAQPSPFHSSLATVALLVKGRQLVVFCRTSIHPTDLTRRLPSC